MRYGMRFAALAAVLASALAVAGGAEAGNRKAFKALTAEAEAYCAEIEKEGVYDCSVEKCPCADGLREVQRFDKLRTRPACVCTSAMTDRSRINEADATDYCVAWNHDNATEDDRCFVVVDGRCPAGTSELKSFYRLRARGPEHLACRGKPPEEEEDEEESEETESEGGDGGG